MALYSINQVTQYLFKAMEKVKIDTKFIAETFSGDTVEGYYVKARGHHYILQDYNDNGYDERWETSDWIEIDIKTLKAKP